MAAAALAYAVWLAAAAAIAFGRWHPEWEHLWRAGLLGGVPLAAIGAWVLLRATPPALPPLATALAVTAAALYGAPLVARQPLVVLVVPVLAGAAALAARRPSAAVVGVIALTGAYGSLTAFTPLEPGQAVDVLLAGLWIAVLARLALGRRPRGALLWPGTVAVAAYLFVTVAAIPLAPELGEGLRAFRSSGWYMLALLLIAYGGFRAGELRRIATGVVVIALLVGAYATLRWAIGPAGAEEELARANDPSGNWITVGGELKVMGSLTSGPELGAWSAVLLPFCLAAALAWRGRTRIAAAVAVPLLAVGLIGSDLRMGLVAAVAGIVVVLVVHQLARGWAGPRLGLAIGGLLALVVAAVVIFPAVVGDNQASRQRYSNLLTPTRDFSYQERVFKWRTAIADLDHHPLGRGLGTGGVRTRHQRFLSKTLDDIDSSYLKVAYEQGFAVMWLFVAALALLWLGLARRAVWTRDPRRAAVAIGACGTLAAFAVILVSGLFVDLLPALTAWIVTGLGVAQFSFAEELE